MRNFKKQYNYIFKTWKLILLCIPLIFCFAEPGYAIDLFFQWDANTESDLAGYRVFCREQGQSYDYNNPIWEGTNTTCTIYDLDETKTYYFVSRAFDIYGLESINSDELVFEAATTADNQPPIADAGPNHVCCVDTITNFDASASSDPDGDNLIYSWDFGDGTITRGSIFDHSYSKSGSYNVFLTVDDNSGTACNKSTAGFIAEVNTSPVPVINIR